MNYYKKSKKIEKIVEKHKESESEESEFEESEGEFDEETKKHMEELMKKYDVDDDLKKKR